MHFKIHKTIDKEVLSVLSDKKYFDIGIHVRITDGGFKTGENRMKNNIDKIINQNSDKNMCFCSDSEKFSIYIKNTYRDVIQYYNHKKFINNDTGTFYGMVDMILLSKCKQMYVTPGSSFSFMSYVMNDIKEKSIDYL